MRQSYCIFCVIVISIQIFFVIPQAYGQSRGAQWIKVTNDDFDLLYKQFLIEKTEKKAGELAELRKRKAEFRQAKDRFDKSMAEVFIKQHEDNLKYYEGSKYRVYWFKDRNVFFGKSGTIWRLTGVDKKAYMGVVAPEPVAEFGGIVTL